MQRIGDSAHASSAATGDAVPTAPQTAVVFLTTRPDRRRRFSISVQHRPPAAVRLSMIGLGAIMRWYRYGVRVRYAHASSSSMFLYQPHPRCQQTHVNMTADYGGKWLYPLGDPDPHFYKSAYSIWTLFYPCSALLHCSAYRWWRQPKMSSSASRAFIVSLSVADPDCRLIASSSAVLNPHLGLQDASSIRSAVQPHYSVHTTLGIHRVTVT